ncbi:hypothetical protein CSA56_08250 [candidate division KSB3 bacterium]|uniref:Uncharacterized protein n=1 Tax=candidate division KSB3 bacterium TaxID=2044937 RepID=A0A2G6KFB1_9BACT|nr:MAG: hypothetical protein CSA56_08250 [candidate division KSB3 bacterium]
MAIKKAEVRLLFTNGKEDVLTVEYEEGDERLQPSYYLGGAGKENSNIENKVIQVGNKAYRTKYIIFAEIIETQGSSLGAYV